MSGFFMQYVLTYVRNRDRIIIDICRKRGARIAETATMQKGMRIAR